MLIRALIVLLLVLNLGVALWWISRPSPTPSAAPVEPAPGVARLQLLSETDADPRPPESTAAAPVVSQCLAFGPFDNAAEASQVQSKLRAQVLQLQPRREYAGTARSWKVLLPPAASMDAAEAAAQRVAAAGFKDHFLVRDGEDARSVALGLYRSEATARERVATLAAAGFEAVAEPVGAGPAEHWLDVGATSGFDPAAAQALVAAARAEPIDCQRLTPAVTGPAR
ncbi:MAG: SPOR domain-containing protein [Lysobacter sp.]